MFTNEETDVIFQALANQHRRRMMDYLKAKPGMIVGELARHFDVSRIAVMNHLAVLAQAGLVISVREGRSRRLYLNTVPIQGIYDRWTTEYSAHWAQHLTGIKYAAEKAERDRRVSNGEE
jgi:DNA-binding transcriptional ArsR family regulator